jgi:hypothetical protein
MGTSKSKPSLEPSELPDQDFGNLLIIKKIRKKLQNNLLLRNQVYKEIGILFNETNKNYWDEVPKQLEDVNEDSPTDSMPLFLFSNNITGKFLHIYGEFLYVRKDRDEALFFIEFFMKEGSAFSENPVQRISKFQESFQREGCPAYHMISPSFEGYYCYNNCCNDCLTKGLLLYENLLNRYLYLTNLSLLLCSWYKEEGCTLSILPRDIFKKILEILGLIVTDEEKKSREEIPRESLLDKH